MKFLVTISAAILFVTGCCKPCIQTSTSNQKDSVRTEVRFDTIEKLRDTIIHIPADSSLIEALFECDSLRQVQLKSITAIKPGKNIKPSISMEGNKATFKCEVDSLEVVLTWIEKHLSQYKYVFDSHSNDVTTAVENRVNYVTGWQWFQIWVGRIVLILLLLYSGYKFLSSKFSTPINLLKWVKSLSSKGKAD